MSEHIDVAVVGGGLAGLVAASVVRAQGRCAVVLEPRPPGGRARVTQRGDFTFNFGGHALYRGGEGMGILQSLGVEPAGSRPPLRRYRLLDGDGSLHAMPSGPASMATTSALRPLGKAQLTKLFARLPFWRTEPLAGLTVDEWVGGLELEPEAGATLRALVRIATYGDDFSTLSADAAVRQLQLAARQGVLYLHGGWSQLFEPLAHRAEIRSFKAARVEPDSQGVSIHGEDGSVLRAAAAVVAAGAPRSAAAVLPGDPGWGDLGPDVTAACLDLGLRRAPDPGYVLGLVEPLYATTQGPPARQAPTGQAVMAVIRYGATEAVKDRANLERFRVAAGVGDDDIVESRFLSRATVTGPAPSASRGGLAGRPRVDSTGSERVFVAGDWVGPVGLLADAAIASGRDAALAAVRAADRSRTMVP